MIANESFSSVSGPKFMVPRHNGLTLTPKRPRVTYRMSSSSGRESHRTDGDRTSVHRIERHRRSW
jgi:hypothetical protein